MAKYSALVKDGNRSQIVYNKEHKRKSDFIAELRSQGYKVNPKKVKQTPVFDYITEHTAPWDWSIKKVPENLG